MVTAFGLQMLRKHQLIWENDTYPYLFTFRISILTIFAALIGLIVSRMIAYSKTKQKQE